MLSREESMEFWIDLCTVFRYKLEEGGPNFEFGLNDLNDSLEDIKQQKAFTKTPSKKNATKRRGARVLFPDELDDDNFELDPSTEFAKSGKVPVYSEGSAKFYDATSPDTKGCQDDGEDNKKDEGFENIKSDSDRITDIEVFLRIFSTSYNTMVDRTQKSSEFLANGFQAMSQNIGKRVSIPISFESPSLWGTLGSIAEHVASNSPDTSEFETRLNEVQELVNAATPLSSFESFVEGWKRWVKEDEELANQGPNFTEDDGDLRVRFDRLTEQFLAQKTMFQAQQQAITELRAQFAMLTAEKDGTMAKFGRVVLNALPDSTSWCDKHPEFRDNFGLLCTFHLFCCDVFEALEGDTSWFKYLKDLDKTKLLSTENVKAVMSYQMDIPPLFSAKQNARTDQNSSSFDRYKKGDDFNPTVVDKLLQKSGIVQTNWSERIDNCFSEDKDINALCQLALKSSANAFERFLIFLQSRRDKFINKGFSEAKAWALTTRLGHTLCMELSIPRNKIHKQIKYDNLPHTAALHLLASIRSLARMEQLLATSFERDQSLATTIVEFSMENPAKGEGRDGLQKEFDTLEKKLENKFIKNSVLSLYAK